MGALLRQLQAARGVSNIPHWAPEVLADLGAHRHCVHSLPPPIPESACLTMISVSVFLPTCHLPSNLLVPSVCSLAAHEGAWIHLSMEVCLPHLPLIY